MIDTQVYDLSWKGFSDVLNWNGVISGVVDYAFDNVTLLFSESHLDHIYAVLNSRMNNAIVCSSYCFLMKSF